MSAPKPEMAECEIGKYVCPNTRSPVSLMGSRPFAFLEWPVVVEVCSDCGQRHVLQPEDIQHRPAFGYE